MADLNELQYYNTGFIPLGLYIDLHITINDFWYKWLGEIFKLGLDIGRQELSLNS